MFGLSFSLPFSSLLTRSQVKLRVTPLNYIISKKAHIRNKVIFSMIPVSTNLLLLYNVCLPLSLHWYLTVVRWHLLEWEKVCQIRCVVRGFILKFIALKQPVVNYSCFLF